MRKVIAVFSKNFSKVPRASFSHSIKDDLRTLVKSFMKKDDNTEIIKFEKAFANYVGRADCVSFQFARTALHFSLIALGAKKGDKIILPPITIKGMLDVVLNQGLQPIFVDIDLKSACFNKESLKEAIQSESPKFCLLTYLFGSAPDIEGLMEVLNSGKVKVIEDFSQGLNIDSEFSKAGNFGEISIYSASAIKTLDTFGGGFAFTNNADLSLKLRNSQNGLERYSRIWLSKKILTATLKNIVATNPFFSLFTFNIIRGFTQLGSKKFERFVGPRSRMPIIELPKEWFYSYSGLQAKFGRLKLPTIEASDLKRREYAKELIEKLPNKFFVTGNEINRSVFWQLIYICENSDEIRSKLLKLGVDSAYTSLILLSNLPKYGIDAYTPNAKKLYEHGVYLPCYGNLTMQDKKRVLSALENL